MIANITSGSGSSGLINYHVAEEKQASLIQIENSITQDLDEFGKMIDYHNSKTIVKQPNIHVSLSPDPKDNISDQKFIEMAQDYMKEMGYGNQPTAFVIHNDTNIKHIHCFTSRIDVNTGKKISDSHEQYRSQRITRNLEEKYKLEKTSSKKSKRKITEEYRIPVRKSKSDSFKKGHVQKALNYIQRKYKTGTEQELKTLLRTYGIKEEHGRYWLLDKNDKVISKSVKAEFGKEKVINPDLKKGSTKKVKDRIFSALKESGSMDEFKARLQASGIFAHEHRNGTGKVFGMSYIDDNSGRVWKSSELSKELSFNKVNKSFEDKQDEQLQKELSDIQKAMDRVGDKYKFKSENEFKILLNTYGIKESSGKYYFIDHNGENISKGLETDFNKEKLIILDLKKGSTKKVKDRIFSALKESGSMDEFKARLQASGIFAHEHRNSTGNVFGMSYVDDNSGRVWKSSELSKELSFNKVNKSFEDKQNEQLQKEISVPGPGYTQPGISNISNPLKNLSGGGDETNDSDFRKKKKKKKGRGL